MKAPFYSRYAWILLTVTLVAFPLGLYGARQAIQGMKNDVQKWLPETFRETTELEWFRERFIDEQFVVISWPGCQGDGKDKRFDQFVALLHGETPPSVIAAEKAESAQSSDVAQAAGSTAPGEDVASRFGLYGSSEDYINWGGQQEKWVRGIGESWYYLLPNGELYRWQAAAGLGPAGWRVLTRLIFGPSVSGEKVADLGEIDGPWYYERPQRLSAPLFSSVTSGPQVRDQLTAEGGGLAQDPEEAMRRLDGILFGPDGEQTCLIAALSDYGQLDLHRVVGRGLMGKPRGRILEIADRCGIPEADLHLGGPPVDNVAIDEEGSITLVRLIGLCVGVGLLLAYLCLRSFVLMIMVFIVGGLSAVLSMALVYWTGGYVDAVLMSMPALTYVLALSGAIHIVNYYRDVVAEGVDVRHAATEAARHGWWPCTICALTTSLGMVSLCTSEIQPIRNFGIYAGAGVLVALAVLFVYLPSALHVCPPRIHPKDLEGGLGIISLPNGFWSAFSIGVVRHRRWVGALISALLIWLTFGATKINTSVEILKMFDPRAKIIRDYTWLEQNLGKLVPMELVLKIPAEMQRPPAEQLQSMSAANRQLLAAQLPLVDRMQLTDTVQRIIEERFGEQQSVVGRSMSAATFAPPLPMATGEFRKYAHRTAINAQLEEHLPELLDTEYLRIDPDDDSELWRISLRLGALQNVDYGLFVHQLRGEVEPIIAAQNVRWNLLNKLAEERGDFGLAGATVGIVHVLPEDPAKGDEENVVADNTLNVGEILANKDVEQGGLTFSTRQRDNLVQALSQGLRSARLRVDIARVRPSEFAGQLVQLLDNFDAIVICGSREIPNLEQLVDHPLWIAAPDGAVSWDDHQGAQTEGQIAAVYTGVVPLVYKAQRTLLENLIESSVWSGLLVSVSMILLLVPGRTLRERLQMGNLLHGTLAGLISMLPNIFPLILVFGAIGWLGIKVDIGSMMTASVALGIAVDDTIHYLTWFRWGLGEGQTRREAIRTAYLRSGNAMIHTTIIGGVGMFVFAASTFAPTQRFGYLMLTLLTSAMLGDLLWAPTLYSGWLGRFFHPANMPHGNTPNSPTSAAAQGETPQQSAAASSSGAVLAMANELPGGVSVPAAHFHHGAASARGSSS